MVIAVGAVGAVGGTLLTRGAAPTPARVPAATSPGRDLGPTTVRSVDFIISLTAASRPTCLFRWAHARQLDLSWFAGQRWATLSGAPRVVDRFFDVRIDNYSTSSGVVFSSNRSPATPRGVCGEVAGVGAIHSLVAPTPLEVPAGGLSRVDLMTAYDAVPLAEAGFAGQGQTVVFIEFTGFKPSDLTLFARDEALPGYNLTLVGKNTGGTEETPMDIETVHEIAPDAHLVFYNLLAAPSTASYGAAFSTAIHQAASRWPHAIFSISLGLCETNTQLFKKADVIAMNAAIASAEAKGATVFASSGDSGGLDCTTQSGYGQPPTSSEVGVEEPAALPAVTGTGGTSLTTDSQGDYIGEATWSEPLLAQGSGGGVSHYFARPSWQVGDGTGGQVDAGNGREVPDVSADADPSTGNFIIEGGAGTTGGGTSLASPIWAGFTALIDQALEAKGGHPVGFFNPLLYHLASSNPPYPPFHDITLGGNDFYTATPGYDLVTGLGSPDVYNLARDLLAEGA